MQKLYYRLSGRSLLLLAASVAVVAGSSPANADLVNGGFEQGSTGWTVSNAETFASMPLTGVVYDDPVGHTLYSGTDPGVTNEINTNNGNQVDHGKIAPDSGFYYASLSNDRNGHGPGVFSQAVTTNVGDVYKLTFALNALPQVAGNDNILFTAYASSSAPAFTQNNAAAPPGWLFGNFYTSELTPVFSLHGGTAGWTTETVTFVATSGQTTISFAGINDPQYTGLDNVSLQDLGLQQRSNTVPLPGNLTMCGITAMLGFCVYRYRRELPLPA